MEQLHKADVFDPSEGETVPEDQEGLPEGSNRAISLAEILFEGKQVGQTSADITRDIVLSSATTRGASFVKDKSKARSAARRELEKVLKVTYSRLMEQIASFRDGKISFTKFSKNFKKTLKSAYYKSYELGLKSTGAGPILTAGGSPLMLPSDRKWIDSAFRYEMRFLNKFLKDIRNNKRPGSWPHRTGMYVSTVGSVYYSGRVAVTPPNSALFWIANIDHRICPQCRYMSANSPYTKFNIPITPASGYTQCLANCRCKISVRQVDEKYFINLKRRSVSRDSHLRRLRKVTR
jgi:hypothetical protein